MNRRSFTLAAMTLPAAVQSCATGGRDGDDLAAYSEEMNEAISDTMLEEFAALAGHRLDFLWDDEDGESDERETAANVFRSQSAAVPQISPQLRDIMRVKKYWDLAEGDQAQFELGWPSEEESCDNRHLRRYGAPSGDGFELTSRHLVWLASRNSFQFRDRGAVRLFGLRGCIIDGGGDETGWRSTISLRVATPDHVHRRCVIGAWRPNSGELCAFTASTVPQAGNMYKSLQDEGSAPIGCSLLPTGLYRYRVGVHCKMRRGQLNPQRQIGVPVHDQSGQYLVLRVTRELRYDVFSKYTAWTPGGAHNIHTAGVGSTNPRFDSSGCQVIRGGFPRDGVFPTGPFRAFRDAIGLGVDTAEETPGSGTIEYMLLTGREAELAARAESNFVGSYQCLRFGSSGPEVTALQTRLFERFPTVAGRSVTTDTPGTFGIGSSLAALAEKKETAGEEDYTSPIVTIDR